MPPSASFEWAYPKTGLTGAESSTFFLTRLIGLRRAFGLVFLNPRLEAREALEAGLINGVFPTGRFDREVLAVAERLAAGPTRAYGITKRLINEASGIERLDTHMDKELRNLVEIAQGEDFSEGLEAFHKAQRAIQRQRPMKLNQHILLGHGSGGKPVHELIEQLFQPALLSCDGIVLNDAAVFQAGGARLAMTTDSFVVDPIFPGWRYRRNGDLWHRKRSRRKRRAPVVSERSLHPGRGAAHGRSQPHRGFDAARVRSRPAFSW